MRGSHKRWSADPCGKEQHKVAPRKQQEEINHWHWMLFPADIYLRLGIPSWREEATTNRRNLPWPLYANLTFLHLPGGEAFIYFLPAWLNRQEWIQIEYGEGQRNTVHDCNFRTCNRHYNLNVTVEIYTPQANEHVHVPVCSSTWAFHRSLTGRDAKLRRSPYLCLAHQGPQQIPLAYIWRVIDFGPGGSEFNCLCHNGFSRCKNVKLSSNSEMSEGEFVTILNSKLALIYIHYQINEFIPHSNKQRKSSDLPASLWCVWVSKIIRYIWARWVVATSIF